MAAIHSSSSSSAQDTLGLAVAGLSEPQRELLRSILVVLEERTERPWRLCDAAQADLLVHTRDVDIEPRNGALHGVFVREGEATPGGETLQVSLPLRVMGVLDALNSAGERLVQRRFVPKVVVAPAANELADDDLSLAAALSRLDERKQKQNLRVRIVGVGTLWLDLHARRYRSDFAPARLDEALGQHRFVVTALAQDAPELAPQADERALEEVLWRVGLMSPWHRNDLEHARWRLRRWPDLAQWPHRMAHVQLCAALAARPCTLAELAAAAGASRCDAMHLLHACVLCGLAELAPDAAPVVAASTTPTKNAGLFDRLRRRLGF